MYHLGEPRTLSVWASLLTYWTNGYIWLLTYAPWSTSRVLILLYPKMLFWKSLWILMLVEWCFETNLKLWNEKSKLEHLAYEVAMLCFKCVQSKFYWNYLIKPCYDLTWIRLVWSWDISLISHWSCVSHMPSFWVMTIISIFYNVHKLMLEPYKKSFIFCFQ